MSSHHNKMVAKVVVIWEEIQCCGNVPGWQTWTVARKSKLFEHSNAKHSFVFPKEALFASTCATNILIGKESQAPVWDLRTLNGEYKIIER